MFLSLKFILIKNVFRRLKDRKLKDNELTNLIAYHNQQNNEKINIITKDMENLLNNDKILLDKLIEKNIVSTIQ